MWQLREGWLPKDGNGPEEYEDAFRSLPEQGRFAVADGATETSFSGIWAAALVAAFAQAPPAAGADATELATYRTSNAIALRVAAPGATFTVDGKAQGATKRYSGGLGSNGWLVLPAGKHRISITAPGFQQQDVIVDVTGSATEDKLLIPVRLEPGG